MRILLVDDHVLFRDALIGVLGRLTDAVRVFSAGSTAEALAAADHYQRLDLVLLDLYLPGSDGMSLLRALRERLVSVPIVLVSASERPDDVQAALDAGAAGYIPKTLGAQDMLAALRQVLNGDIHVPPGLLAAMRAAVADAGRQGHAGPSPGIQLTGRQREVLRLLRAGLSNKGIANRLALTEGTVKLHVSAILRSLDARNRTEAVVTAERIGVLGP